MYLDSVGVALVAVWRILAASSPVGCRPRTCCRIRWPGRSCCWRCWACWCWCCAADRLAAGGALLPGDRAVRSAEADPLLNGRSLMPVAVVGIVAIGVAVGALAPIVAGWSLPGWRSA